MKTIKSKRAFEKVFVEGKRYSSPFLHIRVAPADHQDLARVAFVAPKRIGNAVLRNRCKRLLRSAAVQSGLPCANTDIILMATNKTSELSSIELERELEALLAKAGL